MHDYFLNSPTIWCNRDDDSHVFQYLSSGLSSSSLQKQGVYRNIRGNCFTHALISANPPHSLIFPLSSFQNRPNSIRFSDNILNQQPSISISTETAFHDLNWFRSRLTLWPLGLAFLFGPQIHKTPEKLTKSCSNCLCTQGDCILMVTTQNAKTKITFYSL